MVNSLDEKRTMVKQPLLKKNTHKKGGLWALPFILGNAGMERMATYGLGANMIVYLTKEYHMEMAKASNILLFWSAANNLTPVVWAIIADSYLGRFYTIGFGSLIYLVGTVLLWATTVIPQARPPACDPSTELCTFATLNQTLFLCASLGLIAIGAGGIKSSSLAFGANQLENKDAPENSGVDESYFSWYFVMYTVSILVALTCVVYVQDNMGWKVGFAVPAVLVMLGTLSFFLASRFYVEVQSKTNFTGYFQVVAASYKNRHFELPTDTKYGVFHYNNGLVPGLPSTKLRFLNKACIVKDPLKDLTPDGKAADPSSLCTVEQVEELKSLLGLLPIWSTGILMVVCVGQNSFPVLQAASTNRHITQHFTIPSASLSLFTVISAILWVALYDRAFIPLSSKLTGRPVHINAVTRMGFGISLTFVSMIVTAVIESIRRARSLDGVQMSALWLVPQYCVNGFADASAGIAQNEFYFSESPRSMSSVVLTLGGLGAAVGNLVASVIMNVVDYASRVGGRDSWISRDVDKGRYDYYYLVLAGLGLGNIVYFRVCSRAYCPLKAERTVVEKGEEL